MICVTINTAITPKPPFAILFVFLITDMLISFSALLRQNLRRHDIPPYTVIGEIYDKVYTDEFLHHYFPNMEAK